MSDTTTEAGNTTARPRWEQMKDGTLHWTLSLYIGADIVKTCLRKSGIEYDEHDLSALFRHAQLRHAPSCALRDAIDPLFNDIADRERLGRTHDFLLAAGTGSETPTHAGLSPIPLRFNLPPEFSWTTEGKKFTFVFPAGVYPSPLLRELNLRRFWYAHSNGALSYHLSFIYHYGEQRSIETYYFLSLLQKLAMPKEFTLNAARQAELIAGKPWITVFDDELGIDPLDRITVQDLSLGKDAKAERFWPFVRTLFARDAKVLFEEVLPPPAAMRDSVKAETGDWWLVSTLLKWKTSKQAGSGEPLQFARMLEDSLVELIEVPGLHIPRSRSLFHVQDERFFKRLLPVDRATGEPVSRRLMIQDICYRSYQQKIRDARDGCATVHISEGPGEAPGWIDLNWLRTRPDYKEALAGGYFATAATGGTPITTWEDFEKAIREEGKCWQVKPLRDTDHTPVPLYAPACEAGRADCIDYMFLAGFNQNIIDWLNQDTSEMLDSTDPLYPTSDEQTSEAFFVRYANHRALITYIVKSRSLEVGNDYIGTCPYAFLIHILAIHNEFLARDHELHTSSHIRDINKALRRGDERFEAIENTINDLKAAHYDNFEFHRYRNVFRYDTERDVFSKLEQLRGIERRDSILAEAINSLEDRSYDLENRREAHRNRIFAAVGLTLSLISAVGLLFNAGAWLRPEDAQEPAPSHFITYLGLDSGTFGYWLGEIASAISLFGFAVLLPVYLVYLGFRGNTRRKKAEYLNDKH